MRVPYADDAVLAVALAAGQAAAAAAAWDRFAPLVRSLLWQTLGPGAELDDLLQEVFMTLFRRAGDLRDANALTSFVVGITVRTARSELRRRRVRRWLTLSPEGALPDLAGDDVDHSGREALARVHAILDRLDAETRLAFVLRHAGGLELAEVAAALECSLATAKRRLAKATERVLLHAKSDPVLRQFVAAQAATDPGEEK
jgi:RNA polymerase sigma-70 factor (ECF subfamily)